MTELQAVNNTTLHWAYGDGARLSVARAHFVHGASRALRADIRAERHRVLLPAMTMLQVSETASVAKSINVLPVRHFALGAALRRDGAREAGSGWDGQLQHDDGVRAVRLCSVLRVHKEDRA